MVGFAAIGEQAIGEAQGAQVADTPAPLPQLWQTLPAVASSAPPVLYIVGRELRTKLAAVTHAKRRK